jgi:hypothetical protein
MFGIKTLSIDELFHKRVAKFQLKERVKAACRDNTDYDLHLRNFLIKNRNNQKLIVNVAGYMNYLHRCGLTTQQAAKEVLEKYQH